MELSVSVLNSKNKKEIINILNNSHINYIHMDVMDGIFVSKTSLPSEELIELSKETTKKLDVHLMVEDPLSYIKKIKDLSNIEYITIHLEIDKDIKEILSKIKEYGFKTGLSIKPNTDINLLLPYLDYVDLILIMTVEPGLGGQSFIKTSPSRIKKIKEMIKEKNILLEVDGGINNETIKEVSNVDISVVGSYITTSEEPLSRIEELKQG